jgi:hypothetical protein|tara:strand:+ start:97 stop:531 length:435 start_codon:yes stop_codon:yes gene_type:complete
MAGEPKGFQELGGESLEDYTSGMSKKEFMAVVTKLKKTGAGVSNRTVESVYNSRYAKDANVSPLKKKIKSMLNNPTLTKIFGGKVATESKKEIAKKKEKEMDLPKARPKNLYKGGSATKKNIGSNDYRKGGYVLSTVDNRKKKS